MPMPRRHQAQPKRRRSGPMLGLSMLSLRLRRLRQLRLRRPGLRRRRLAASLPSSTAPPAAMSDAGRPAQPGPDGRLRCPWAVGSADYLAYHDEEWGKPVRDDRGLFERLSLEGFQSGLSWLTILRKRENFRAAFGGFDLETVAGFGPADVTRLLGDAGIVRNRAKIEAVIRNAAAALTIPGGLAALVWSYAGDPAERGPGPRTTADIAATTPQSTALSKDLRRRGFTFTGPVTVYATFQACGLVDDHLQACFCRGQEHSAIVGH